MKSSAKAMTEGEAAFLEKATSRRSSLFQDAPKGAAKLMVTTTAGAGQDEKKASLNCNLTAGERRNVYTPTLLVRHRQPLTSSFDSRTDAGVPQGRMGRRNSRSLTDLAQMSLEPKAPILSRNVDQKLSFDASVTGWNLNDAEACAWDELRLPEPPRRLVASATNDDQLAALTLATHGQTPPSAIRSHSSERTNGTQPRYSVQISSIQWNDIRQKSAAVKSKAIPTITTSKPAKQRPAIVIPRETERHDSLTAERIALPTTEVFFNHQRRPSRAPDEGRNLAAMAANRWKYRKRTQGESQDALDTLDSLNKAGMVGIGL